MNTLLKIIIIIAIVTIGGFVVYTVSQTPAQEIVEVLAPIDEESFVTTPNPETNTTMEVTLPLATESSSGDFGPFGCGQYLNFHTFEVPQNAAVLNASYQKLFALPYDVVEVGDKNIIASQSMLTFDSVSIENAVASVYLSGTIMGNHCADEVLRQQIEQTAFQFDTVQTIQVFLNNELFDWCALSDADPSESNCNTNPRPWITNKTPE